MADESRLEPLTTTAPEAVVLAPGIRIIEDITDQSRTAGIETLEGRIGPLLLGQGCQGHFIDMPAGMFVDEHPHSTESLIYTVRGNWVLCSGGSRRLMRPCSLFWFGAGVATGYEVPFNDPAYILIFKAERTSQSEEEFMGYVQRLSERLRGRHAEGNPFTLSELPMEHPALQFARTVNPDLRL